MCLIAFAYKSHPDYPLILITNRDEFYNRPTRKAQFWIKEGHPEILAGKDLTANGTWFGVHKNGKWAILTNYRDLNNVKNDVPSRGDLVLNYLKSNLSVRDYATKIKKDADKYNGFNLLIGDKNDIIHYTNELDLITLVPHGVHGLSNSLLNTPWTKTENSKAQLQDLIAEDNLDIDQLFEILLDETKADDEDLPETGLSKAMEKAISSSFIITPDYGTRCSTILMIDTDGKIAFIERTFKTGTKDIEDEVRFEW